MSIWILAWHWMLHATIQQFVGLALMYSSGGFLWFWSRNVNRLMDDL